MKHSTAKKFQSFVSAFAKGYGVTEAEVFKAFSVEPSIAQTLHDRIEESHELLQKINIVPVDEKTGQKVFGGATGPIIGRTDTTANDRTPTNVLGLTDRSYTLHKTESDVLIEYVTLDLWAKFPDFMARWQTYVNKRKALDRIMVGWNGTSAAAETDLTANPLGQDVNVGWLQQVRDLAPAQVLTEGDTAGKIQLGSSGDFKNLDQLVQDVKQGIDHKFRDGSLIAIVGSDLLAWDEGKLYAAHGNTPTEKAGIHMATQSYGGLPTATNIPYFPEDGLVVTSWENLSIYWQQGSDRRKVEDNAKRDRIEDYHSRNEGYVVEELAKMAFIEADNVEYV